MKDKKITYYTIYEITKNNEIINKKESKNLIEICDYLQVNYKHINQYTTTDFNNIDNVKNKHIYNNKYVVLKEKINLSDLEVD